MVLSSEQRAGLIPKMVVIKSPQKKTFLSMSNFASCNNARNCANLSLQVFKWQLSASVHFCTRWLILLRLAKQTVQHIRSSNYWGHLEKLRVALNTFLKPKNVVFILVNGMYHILFLDREALYAHTTYNRIITQRICVVYT